MPKPPNILLITTDQQRWDTVRPAAPAWMRTPHHDRLAREGLRFARAYTQCPICTPARISIMLGQSPQRSGHLWFSYPPLDARRTLPGLLAQAGYQTCAIGKMHFHPPRARHGFGEQLITEDYYRACARRGLKPLFHGVGQNEAEPALATVREEDSITAWTAEESVEWLTARRDPTAPFFLWTSFSKPHPPYDPPEPYYSLYRDQPLAAPLRPAWALDERCPEALRRHREEMSYDQVSPETWRAARAAYLGLVTQCDYALGRVLAALEESGQSRDTLVIFTSDHGDLLGDFATGAKNFFYEGATRVPLVIRPPPAWGAGRPFGQVSEALATHADLLPTCLAAAGLPVPADCDGQDLLAVAAGRCPARSYLDGLGETNPPDRPAVESQRAWAGITDGRWKYLWWPEGGCEQLFDLASDPQEERELSTETAAQAELARLRSALIERHRDPAYAGHGYLDGDRLRCRPLQGDSTSERRTRSWAGLQTGYRPSDIKH